MLRRTLANIGWMAGGRSAAMLVGMLASLWVARYLGPEDFGQLSFVLAIVALLSAIASVGLRQTVTKDLISAEHDQGNILASAGVLRIVGGIVTYIVLLILAFLFDFGDQAGRMLAAVAGLLLIARAGEVVRFWFDANLLSKHAVLIEMAIVLIGAIARVVLVAKNASLLAFAALLVVEALTISAALTFLYLRRSKSTQLRFSRVRSLLKRSWPLIVAGTAVSLYMRIDQVMLGHFRGAHEVGLYSAAVKLSEMWHFCAIAIIASVTPALIAARSKDSGLYLQRLRYVYQGLVLAALVVAVSVMLSSRWIIDTAFGSEFADAALPLSIHVWGGIFVVLGVASSQWMVNEDLQKYAAYRTVAGAGVNIALNFVLIPAFGSAGAAIATVFAYGVATFGLFCFQQTRPQAIMMLGALNPYTSIRSLINVIRTETKPLLIDE